MSGLYGLPKVTTTHTLTGYYVRLSCLAKYHAYVLAWLKRTRPDHRRKSAVCGRSTQHRQESGLYLNFEGERGLTSIRSVFEVPASELDLARMWELTDVLSNVMRTSSIRFKEFDDDLQPSSSHKYSSPYRHQIFDDPVVLIDSIKLEYAVIRSQDPPSKRQP